MALNPIKSEEVVVGSIIPLARPYPPLPFPEPVSVVCQIDASFRFKTVLEVRN